jgi:tyrosine-protein kinase
LIEYRPETRQLTLSEYLSILQRRKWVILEVTIAVAVVAVVLSLQQSKLYRASAEMLISRQDLGFVLTGNTNPQNFVPPERSAETQARLARVPNVIERAAANVGIRGLSTSELLDKSSVSPRANADLLVFTVEDNDPNLAARLATAYARGFASYKLALDTGALRRARGELEQRLDELRQEGDRDSALFRSLAADAQELRTLELLQQRNTVVKGADRGAQVAPRPVRNGAVGVFVGLVLGLGAAFLWEALDKRVRSEEELEARLGLPLLSRLPEPTGRLRQDRRLAMLADPNDYHAEAVRRLRTNIEFANLERHAQTIMVTSAVQREGKSTTVGNLAVAFARAGRHVVLVDLDLRQPTVHEFFDLRGAVGVTDVALGRASLDNALATITLPASKRPGNGSRPTPTGGRLAVLPAGSLPANAGEFVGTAALEHVLADLRQAFDLVLIDAPPMCVVGDAMTLSAKVDAMIVVTRLGTVNNSTIDDLARELHASPAPKLGFVLTGIDARHAYGHGAYDYYGQKAAEVDAEAAPEAPAVRQVKTERTGRSTATRWSPSLEERSPGTSPPDAKRPSRPRRPRPSRD